MTIPNFITLARIFLIPLMIFFLLFWDPQSGRFIAAGIFALLALTDAVDGFLARKLGQVSSLGKFLDPLADKFLVVAAFTGMVELGIISSIPAMIIIAREFAVMGLRVSAAQRSLDVPASRTAKLKTVLQMTAVLMLLVSAPMAETVLWLAVAATIVSGIEYFLNLKGVVYA